MSTRFPTLALIYLPLVPPALAQHALAPTTGETVLSASAAGQPALTSYTGHDVSYQLDSGTHANNTNKAAVVWTELAHVPGAGWLRLYFASAVLPAGSVLRLTSAYDGSQQGLDRDGLALWENSSGYFNGDTVLVELVAGPHTAGNRVVLSHVATQLIPAEGETLDYCGVCGPDDRVPSKKPWACRLWPSGCSGVLYNTESHLLSAGHCQLLSVIAEFNVPPSIYGTPMHPPIEDQFPAWPQKWADQGIGNDWLVLRSGPNRDGESAYQRYRTWCILAEPDQIPPAGDVQVYGYGKDQQGERHLAQQASSGQIVDRMSFHYVFEADVAIDRAFGQPGSSGSPLLWQRQVIGIVTACEPNCPNYATRIDQPDFTRARAEISQLPPRHAGDANCDDAVNFADINPFVLAVANQDAWLEQYPRCNLTNNDMNCDGTLDFGDINPLVECLGGGNCRCP